MSPFPFSLGSPICATLKSFWKLFTSYCSSWVLSEKEYFLLMLPVRRVYATESIGNASQTVPFYYLSLLPVASRLVQFSLVHRLCSVALFLTPTSSSALLPLMSTQGLHSPPRSSPLPVCTHASLPLFLKAFPKTVIPSLETLPAPLFVTEIFPFLSPIYFPSVITIKYYTVYFISYLVDCFLYYLVSYEDAGISF